MNSVMFELKILSCVVYVIVTSKVNITSLTTVKQITDSALQELPKQTVIFLITLPNSVENNSNHQLVCIGLALLTSLHLRLSWKFWYLSKTGAEDHTQNKPVVRFNEISLLTHAKSSSNHTAQDLGRRIPDLYALLVR